MLFRSKLNVVGSNARVHYSRLVPKQVAEEMISQKKYKNLKGRFVVGFMKEKKLEPMEA